MNPNNFIIANKRSMIYSRLLKTAKRTLFCTLLCSCLFIDILFAQTVPINDIKEEQIRIQQLLQGSEYSSFSNRPVWNHIYDHYMDEAGNGPQSGIWTQHLALPEYDLGYSFKAGAYLPSVQLTTNTRVPYGENNEAAWYGKGLNTELKAGIWITSDYLTITFRPQVALQQNLDFLVPRFIPTDSEGNIRYVAEGIGDIIDRPFRFGPDFYSTTDLGYTSARIHYKPIEAGFSNEPMWWGANVKYPLLMSNNAPGMKHFFVGTRYPVRVPWVGKFEFKWIGAFPEDSDYFDHSEEFQKERFMTGVNIIYSPAFSPNLHLGFARVVHTYIDDEGLTQSDLGIIFDPFYLKEFINVRGNPGSIKPRNHLNSVFGRWVWPESRMEIFAEFFRDDFAWDSRDLLMEPRHNSGYAFGVVKLLDAPYADFYKVNVEFTNMTPGFLEEVRPQDYYYSDSRIPQGHTNKGQVIGAAIGPGSNSQYFGIDGYFPKGRLGLFIRRLADNNHFHYEFDRRLNRPEEFRRGFGDYWRHRTDLTIGVRGLYKYSSFLLTGEIAWTKLYNYGRFDYGTFGPGLSIATFEPFDKTNLQLQVGLAYTF